MVMGISHEFKLKIIIYQLQLSVAVAAFLCTTAG